MVWHSQVIVLATKQFDGLNWLKQYVSWLSQDVEYIGQRNDEAILKETLRACLLGWVAQDLASDVEALIGEDLQVLHQKRLVAGWEKARALEEGFYQQAINAIIN